MRTIIHTVYQTTNILNDVFYAEKHSTTDPHDNYLGSGSRSRMKDKYHIKESYLKMNKGIIFLNKLTNPTIGWEAIRIKEIK